MYRTVFTGDDGADSTWRAVLLPPESWKTTGSSTSSDKHMQWEEARLTNSQSQETKIFLHTSFSQLLWQNWSTRAVEVGAGGKVCSSAGEEEQSITTPTTESSRPVRQSYVITIQIKTVTAGLCIQSYVRLYMGVKNELISNAIDWLIDRLIDTLVKLVMFQLGLWWSCLDLKVLLSIMKVKLWSNFLCYYQLFTKNDEIPKSSRKFNRSSLWWMWYH